VFPPATQPNTQENTVAETSAEATRTPWHIAIEPDPVRPTDTELIETPDLDRLTEALADPDAEQILYRVTYERVGRRGGRDGSTPPPLTVWAMSADDLAGRVHGDIGRYLLSRDSWVTVDLEAMRGQIWAGMNNGGSFTIEPLASPSA